MITRFVAMALAAGLSGAASPPPDAPAQKFQAIDILRPAGAECTFTHHGIAIDVKQKDLGQNPAIGFETDYVALPDSHEDLSLTCRGADGWSETQTLVYGPSSYTSFNGPCGPGAACPQRPWSGQFTVYEYPRVVRMGPYRRH